MRRIGISGIPQRIMCEATALDMAPLDYMLGVMRDKTANPARRDRMAQAAAPYCHPRMAERVIGSKDRALADALRAGEGTEWADILRPLDAVRR
jgi:hypothetical protein